MAIFRELKVSLTDEEWRAASEAMAAELEKHATAEGEKATAMRGFKDRIEASEDALRELGGKVRTRKETRPVECYERHDDRRFVVELFRGDTGELVESRPMRATERSAALQATLPNVVTRNDGEPS